MYNFSTKSKEKLNTCHSDLQLIFNYAISKTNIDFGISEGHRNKFRQNKLFKEGKSKIDGLTKKGKHNYLPSLAVDIYAYYNKNAQFDYNSLCYLAGVIQTVAKVLFQNGDIEHLIRWGGNWDKDGIIIKDQSFNDLVHFELYKPKK